MHSCKVSLPGGGSASVLGSSLDSRLVAIEQTLDDGRRFRWLCATRPGVELAVETIVPLTSTESSSGPCTRNTVSQPLFDRSTLLPEYHLAMVAALGLSKRASERMAFLGVGGGALPLFLAQHHPRCVMTAIEPDKEALELAGRFFGLQSGPRLRLHALTAEAYLRNHGHTSRFDAIFLDASNAADGCAPPPALCSCHALRRLLRRHLRPGGVLAINVHGASAHHALVRRSLCAAASRRDRPRDRPLLRVETAEGNVVLVACVRGEQQGIAAAASEREPGVAGASCMAEGVAETMASPIDDRMRPRKSSQVKSLDLKMRRCLASRIGLGEWLSSCNLLGLSVSMLEEDVHVNL